ncbi:MAG TPA: sigma-70 family RNA polymerase sigma factor [Candidatus Acidoferrales bacterium]|nr:sigma-70 family RNA polymerase sigma factor [Candidatus Acidoferrales bacterium]
MKQATAGDANAFRQLVDRHTARLHNGARNVLHNEQDAEDALQDGLLSAYRRIASFEGRSRFATWLTRIVVNSALMIRRRHSQHDVSLDEILEQTSNTLEAIADRRLDPEQTYGAAEMAALIRQKLAELPLGLREAFQLHEVDGLSYDTCAAQLGVERGALKSRVTRARRQLANSLRPVLSLSTRRPERLWFEVFTREQGDRKTLAKVRPT